MSPLGHSPGWIVVIPDGHGAEADRALLFRLKAEEARTAARAMIDPGARQAMLQMADTYNRLARHVAGRGASRDQRPPGLDASLAQSND